MSNVKLHRINSGFGFSLVDYKSDSSDDYNLPAGYSLSRDSYSLPMICDPAGNRCVVASTVSNQPQLISDLREYPILKRVSRK